MAENLQTTGGDEQARKDRILKARADRLAKILSLGTGREVKPSEVKLEDLSQKYGTNDDFNKSSIPTSSSITRTKKENSSESLKVSDNHQVPVTTSPTTSEAAAAGVGSFLLNTNNSSDSESLSSDASNSESQNNIQTSLKVPHNPRMHLLVIMLSAVAFVLWTRYVALSHRNSIDSQFLSKKDVSSPWLVFLTSFLGIEAIELVFGRVVITTLPSDFGIYLFIVLLAAKLHVI